MTTTTKNKTIRIHEDVYEELKRRVEGFETPNDVIRRLLEQTKVDSPSKGEKE